MPYYRNQQGLSIIGCLIAVALAVFGGFAFHHWQVVIIRHERDLVFNRLASAIRYGQTLAMTEKKVFSLCKGKTDEPCSGQWSDGFLIIQGKLQTKTPYSSIQIRHVFTGAHYGQVYFLNSSTLFKGGLRFEAGSGEFYPNGRFLYCPPRYASSQADFLIINYKGGRTHRARFQKEAGLACKKLP